MYGLTGGIATGKSTVAAMLTAKGAVVLDADLISRAILEPGEAGWKLVDVAFPEVIKSDQTIDRKLLGQLIFADEQKRLRLNEILHPVVLKTIRTQGHEAQARGQIVFADIPLLYETNSQSWLEQVWVVYVPQSIQLERLLVRDGLTIDQARQRINAQMSIEKKRVLADQVIDNSGSLDCTKRQVDHLWQIISGG